MRIAVLVVCLWSCGAAVHAAPAPPAAAHEVSPLTVFPGAGAPKVVATFPAAGQAIAAGVLILTVTFDQSMTSEDFDIAAAPGGEAPRCLKTPRLLNDGKTFALLCTTRPGATYSMTFNDGTAGAAAEPRAAPGALSFTTTLASDGPRNIEDALKLAKLKASDVPIQKMPGLGPSPAP